MDNPLVGLAVTWILEPLIIVGLYLIYRGWKARREERQEE